MSVGGIAGAVIGAVAALAVFALIAAVASGQMKRCLGNRHGTAGAQAGAAPAELQTVPPETGATVSDDPSAIATGIGGAGGPTGSTAWAAVRTPTSGGGQRSDTAQEQPRPRSNGDDNEGNSGTGQELVELGQALVGSGIMAPNNTTFSLQV